MNEDMLKLKDVVFRPEWDNMLVHLTNLRASEHEKLENCSADGLKFIQGKISVINDLLTLRDNVRSIMSMK